jgi:uncharacterized protein (DUF433 family)
MAAVAKTDLAPALHVPRYSYTEAARLAGVSPSTARRWLRDAPREGVSFLDLIELVVIGRLLREGVGAMREAQPLKPQAWGSVTRPVRLERLRRLVAVGRERLGAPRPLVHAAFREHGLALVREVLGAPEAWEAGLAPLLDAMDYAEAGRLVRRWWPLGREGYIVVDPAYGFGLPVVAGTGVRTESIQERALAGDRLDQIAADFGLAREAVAAALRFEASAAGHDPA